MALPQRMCVACREMKLKEQLIRVAKDKNGAFTVDSGQKCGGRGAYVCKARACRDRCIKARLMNKAFRCALPTEIYERIDEFAAD